MLVLAHFFSFLSILQTENKTEKTPVTPVLFLRDNNMGALTAQQQTISELTSHHSENS